MRVQRTYNGILTFYGWFESWSLVDDKGGNVDLKEEFWKAADQMKSKPAAMTCRRDFFKLAKDEESELNLEFINRGDGAVVSKREGFGFSSVHSYLEAICQSLNSRRVIVTIEPAGFEIRADPDALNVPALEIDPSTGNMCKVSDEVFRTVCKPGQGAETCIFIAAGAGGIQCAKFSGSMAREILRRKVEGTMSAGRIGNCRCKGMTGHITEDSK